MITAPRKWATGMLIVFRIAIGDLGLPEREEMK